ncbi:MAG TPA: hypothetical protein DCY12_09470 [Candidatus Atribacteria bacterium]|nr:hypothetical protein [Candidatus Atribacteria bacterium]HCU22443.1 hypothetical protein [Candidatus Atribacteria bacterium]
MVDRKNSLSSLSPIKGEKIFMIRHPEASIFEAVRISSFIFLSLWIKEAGSGFDSFLKNSCLPLSFFAKRGD